MHREDLVWLSGLLEGEGCFDLRPQSKAAPKTWKPAARIRLSMTDRDVVERVGKLFQRPVHSSPGRQEGWKTVYCAQIQGQPAANLMTLLLPLMGERRSEKIKEILY